MRGLAIIVGSIAVAVAPTLGTVGSAAAATPTLTAPMLNVTFTPQPNRTFDYTATWTRVPGATTYWFCLGGFLEAAPDLCYRFSNAADPQLTAGVASGTPTLSFSQSGIHIGCIEIPSDPPLGCIPLTNVYFYVVACNPQFSGDVTPFGSGCVRSNFIAFTYPL